MHKVLLPQVFVWLERIVILVKVNAKFVHQAHIVYKVKHSQLSVMVEHIAQVDLVNVSNVQQDTIVM